MKHALASGCPLRIDSERSGQRDIGSFDGLPYCSNGARIVCGLLQQLRGGDWNPSCALVCFDTRTDLALLNAEIGVQVRYVDVE